jgi:hypothetical protein
MPVAITRTGVRGPARTTDTRSQGRLLAQRRVFGEAVEQFKDFGTIAVPLDLDLVGCAPRPAESPLGIEPMSAQ